MTHLIDVCPRDACGSADLYRRRPSIQGRQHDFGYICQACGARFDDPTTRERAGRDGAERSSQLVADLLDADPSEVGP